MAQTAAQAAADKLAKDILIIDVSDRLAITDCFVVVTGTNERQVSSIVDAVEEKMREAGEKPVRREGERDGRWVLLDFLDVVVHVQHSEERVFYALDRLWKDCPSIPFVDADAPAVEQSAAPAVTPVANEGADSPAADLSAGAVTGDDLTVDGGLDAEGLDAQGVRADGVRDDTGATGEGDDPTDDTLDVADEAGDLAAGGPEGAGSGR
nr:ribosome silencing factor [Nakamurella flavida]